MHVAFFKDNLLGCRASTQECTCVGGLTLGRGEGAEEGFTNKKERAAVQRRGIPRSCRWPEIRMGCLEIIKGPGTQVCTGYDQGLQNTISVCTTHPTLNGKTWTHWLLNSVQSKWSQLLKVASERIGFIQRDFLQHSKWFRNPEGPATHEKTFDAPLYSSSYPACQCM